MNTPDTISQLPLEQLHESPFNPRKAFLAIDELAASIKAEGRIHQPLLVRRIALLAELQHLVPKGGAQS
jgi:ParB-like chromosome segregation protein Spo0J